MSDPSVSWGAGLTPDELAAAIRAHPFAAVREPLMQRILFAALGPSQRATPVRFGTLRRTETTRVEPGGLSGFLGSNLIYAPFQHARIPFFELGIEQSANERQRLLTDAGDAYLAGLI